jgi:hypothetical protein
VRQSRKARPIKRENMPDEILTMSEAAAILKMTEKQVYELTRRRSLERMGHRSRRLTFMPRQNVSALSLSFSERLFSCSF